MSRRAVPQMTTEDLYEAAWEDLAASTWRRGLLGRNRCIRLVRLAVRNMPPTARTLSPEGRQTIKRRVRDQYSEDCGSVFVAFILSWAISRIVDMLIDRWWSRGGQA
jgi:hypothetical protein